MTCIVDYSKLIHWNGMNFYTINIFNVSPNISDFWSQYIKWRILNEEPSKTI